VSLLSGRSALSLRSQMTLAEAALLLSELRGTGSQSLYLLTQKLLQKQVVTLFVKTCHKRKKMYVKFPFSDSRSGKDVQLPDHMVIMSIQEPKYEMNVFYIL